MTTRSPHLTLAHTYWESILKDFLNNNPFISGGIIDATCGNGQDTLKLSQILSNSGFKDILLAIDIQPAAIDNTRKLLSQYLKLDELKQIHFFEQSHEDFPKIAFTIPIKLIVYNLGYLPGGNKNLTTLSPTTLISVQKALELIADGGAVSITCYPGHAEGAIEEAMLLEMLEKLDSKRWTICHHQWVNRPRFPSLFLIQKNIP